MKLKRCLCCKKVPRSFCDVILDCGHKYCVDCLTHSVMFFSGITTNHCLNCPKCGSKLNKNQFRIVADMKCNYRWFNRNYYYTVYLCAQEQNEFEFPLDEQIEEENIIDEYILPDIPHEYIEYFSDYDGKDGDSFYKFVYGDPKQRTHFKEFVFKELMEYCYHPSRIKFEL